MVLRLQLPRHEPIAVPEHIPSVDIDGSSVPPIQGDKSHYSQNVFHSILNLICDNRGVTSECSDPTLSVILNGDALKIVEAFFSNSKEYNVPTIAIFAVDMITALLATNPRNILQIEKLSLHIPVLEIIIDSVFKGGINSCFEGGLALLHAAVRCALTIAVVTCHRDCALLQFLATIMSIASASPCTWCHQGSDTSRVEEKGGSGSGSAGKDEVRWNSFKELFSTKKRSKIGCGNCEAESVAYHCQHER